MRKGALLLTMLLAITVIPVLISNAFAQDQPMNPQMRQNLQEMSTLMECVSMQLSTGKMSTDAQKTAALITKQVSQILHELSGPGDADHLGHKHRVAKMKKDWDPWGAEGEGSSKD
ncbi:MAG: hypothetical protein JRF56_06575 [Deltaproteobacteria bacterium]|jgi:hypothetical protein|nr:hypothetical protein [Deltaproteobacteria bacterium]